MSTEIRPYQPLSGHESPDTAYLVDDYPYGYTLRTQIRYWVETKKKHGQRMMSQTMNPKTGKWNKPKASTYTQVIVMALDEKGHIVNQGLGYYDNLDQIELFTLWAQGHLTEWQLGAIDYLKAVQRANQHVKVSAHVCPGEGCTEEHQTLEEQNKLMGKLIAYEMRRGE